MPKTNLCENKEMKRYNYVAGMLACGMRQNNISAKDISKKTMVTERTVYNRLEHPETMRLSELYKIADLLGIKISFELKDIPE